MSKADLRKIFKAKRALLSQDEVKTRSQQINENFLQNLLPKFYKKNSDKIFSLYLEMPSEVSTNLIAEHFIKNQIPFSYPKIIAANKPLQFTLFDQEAEFVANKSFTKIKEPAEGKIISPDFLILPLLAFDLGLSRLGMGGVFFDRTIKSLKKKKSKIITIGLAFDFQLSQDYLPTEETDQNLDFTVTEKNLFSSSRTSLGLST